MTKYFKNLLGNLRDTNSSGESKQHHLFLLGTGVAFVERPTDLAVDKYYIRGETFSYAAQLVTHVLGEQNSVTKLADATVKTSENYAHAYHSPSVDVINGPDTAGYWVGDRVAKGLMLALDAIAQGKKELSVSGFSRGGVEAIVLMHELERVRSALETDLALEDQSACRSLAAIIADSNSVPGMAIIHDPSYTRQALNTLLPGATPTNDDKELKEKLLANLKAMQVKLFVLDPVPGGNFGKVARIGWQEDSFYKELPKFVVKKQEFVAKHETSNCFKPIVPHGMPYEVIPGCHGTGDGNQFDHNGTPVPDSYQHRDLSGVQNLVLRRWLDFTFPDAKPEFDKIDLGHKELDAVTNTYLPADEKKRCEELLKNYTEIQKNYPAFEWLATRNYNGLGQYMPQRQVHFRTRGNTQVTDLDAHGDGKHFMNLQHVQLWMSETLKSFNFFEKTLVDQVKWLEDNLTNAFEIRDGEDEAEEWMVTKLLRIEENHEMLQESLSFLVNTITQTYMRNHLTLEQRQACQDCVAHTFDVLVKCSKESPNSVIKNLADKVIKAVGRDLTTAMLRHQNSLLSVSQQLLWDQEKVISDLDKTDDKKESIDSPLTWLIGAQKVYMELDLLVEQTAELGPWCNQDMLIESWGKMIPNFSENHEGPDMELCKKNLKDYICQQRKLILASAIEMLSKMPEALEVQPRELDTDFYKRIHSQANIHNTAAKVEKLEEQVKTDKAAIDKLEEENAEYAEEQDLLLQKCEKAEARADAFGSTEEEEAVLKVVALKRRCAEYLTHLKDTDDGSQLQKDKTAAVTDMLDTLNDSKLLYTERLSGFNTKVDCAQTLLKEHRDPEWARFFRDCFRILARVFSGIGFYRMARGESPQFFKPSHGEQFVEDTWVKPPVSETPTV